MIELQNISKTYMGSRPTEALCDVSLAVERGDFVSIIGSSGSGKTTLMNIIGCLDTPTSGTYLLDGEDTSHLTASKLAAVRNQKIGFIFQNFNLVASMSALENVALPLMLRGQAKKERLERAYGALCAVGLSDRKTHLPRQLSGGQRQRVAIARVLAADPAVILADEPTGNLDPKSGSDVMEILHQINAQGRTIVLITHDMSIAAQANAVLKMQQGKLII